MSGTRDAFGSPAELQRETKKMKGSVSFHWVETGDHGFKPLKSSGLTVDEATRFRKNAARFNQLDELARELRRLRSGPDEPEEPPPSESNED